MTNIAQSGWKRHLGTHPSTRHGSALFARNTAASAVSFALDMALLWLLVKVAGVDDMLAVTIAFLAAMSFHYLLARIWVFRGTSRGVASGYVYFLVNAVVGLTLTLALFAALTKLTGLHFMAGRALASAVAGIAVFFLNAKLNFRQL